MKTKLLFFAILFSSFFCLNAQTCHNYGDEPSGNTRKGKLNVNKNRHTVPAADEIDTKVTISEMLSSKDDATLFSENKAATITGYLFDALPEGPESCNCKSSDVAKHDIHVFIAPHKNTTSTAQCVVVEITPWVKLQHPEWTADYLKANKGKEVTITGWLLFDWEHIGVSAATHPDKDSNKRGTVWELHPFTSFAFTNKK